jgi:hypothetical protein
MSIGELGPVGSRCLRVLPRSRGSWIVATEQDDVLSEHVTATEAEIAALACLREGEELLVVDRYHRCHRLARPQAPISPRRPRSPAQAEPQATPRTRADSPPRGGHKALAFDDERWYVLHNTIV